jgi:multidrug efflux pump
LSWTMIFGLSFATFLTLILVPSMYLISYRQKKQSHKILEHLGLPMLLMYIPFFILLSKIFVSKSVYKEL